MTALFPNYNSTHSGKTANSQLLNGGQSASAFNRTMEMANNISSIVAMIMSG